MKIIGEAISILELKTLAKAKFGNLVKAVVDVERKIMVIDGDLHSDEEKLLLDDGSTQKNLWGINLYPGLSVKEMIEFDSMINLRPSQNNLSKGVENPETRKKIIEIVNSLIKP